MSLLITDVHENPCVKRGKRDSVGRLYFFLQKVTHAVWALDKPFMLFSLLETYMHLYVIGHSFKMVATLDFIF